MEFLNSSNAYKRLLHLYGPDGHGKCDIANFAAKYALYGRVDLDGALFVNCENKDEVKLLISSICKSLRMRYNYA